jgi:Holliday junction resolvase
MSNKKAGTSFEKHFCNLAAEKGFWAHMLNPDKDGQPADAIICKNNISALIDCKDCKHDTYPFSRIEENQIDSMRKWLDNGNKHALFALNLSDDIWMIPFEFIQRLKDAGFTGLSGEQIRKVGITFDVWMERFNNDSNSK